jgi:hypothetical protein
VLDEPASRAHVERQAARGRGVLVDRFQAGDSFAEIAGDFAVPAEEVEDVIRAALRRVA